MKKRFAFLLALTPLLTFHAICTATSGSEAPLKLIPQPKEVRVRQGSFHVKPTTRIPVEFGHQ